MKMNGYSKQELISKINRALDIGDKDLDRTLIFNGRTYREIIGLSHDIRRQIQDCDASAARVCLATSDRNTILASLLCALAGGPGVVLPHSLSEAVINEACEASGSKLLISDGNISVPKGLESIETEFGAFSETSFEPIREPEDSIAWLFTGGSTGRPKIWEKTVLNIFGEAAFLHEKFGVSSQDVFISAVPPQHIYGLLFSVLLPFTARCCVVHDVPFLPDELRVALGTFGNTVFIGSPMSYKALSRGQIEAPSLRVAFSSGGFLGEDHGRHFYSQTGVGVQEVYGSTETGGIAQRCPAAGQESWEPFSVVRWRIDDERLCVASPFLTPDLPADHQGFYRTGDRVTEDEGGGFVLLGRADGIVKIAGKRVDLGSVEKKINDLQAVQDAYVFAVEGAEGKGNELAALLVCDCDEARLRGSLSKVLQPLEFPRYIVRVDKIPTIGPGKRDRSGALEIIRGQRENNV